MRHGRSPTQVDGQQQRNGHGGVGKSITAQQGDGPVQVEGGEFIGCVLVAFVCPPDGTEGFDHGNAGDKFHHGGGYLGEFVVYLHGFIAHAAHHYGHDEPVDGQCCYSQQPKPPVDHKSIDGQGNRSDHCLRHIHRLVGHQSMHHGDVVLQRFTHLSRIGRGEPAKRRTGYACDSAFTHECREFRISKMRHPQGNTDAREPRTKCADQDVHNGGDARRIHLRAGGVCLIKHRTEFDQCNVGGDGEHTAQSRECSPHEETH